MSPLQSGGTLNKWNLYPLTMFQWYIADEDQAVSRLLYDEAEHKGGRYTDPSPHIMGHDYSL